MWLVGSVGRRCRCDLVVAPVAVVMFGVREVTDGVNVYDVCWVAMGIHIAIVSFIIFGFTELSCSRQFLVGGWREGG